METVEFGDGTVWTNAELRARLIADAATDGSDVIEGFASDDTLEGGPGEDLLRGGNGADEYRRTPGDGDDVIEDLDASGDGDVLRLVGVDPAEVRLAAQGTDLRVEIGAAAGPGTILVRLGLDPNFPRGADRIVFDDGTEWLRDAFPAMALAGAGTPGDDLLLGGPGDDVLAGGEGDDRAEGGLGADLYVYEAGDGSDVIRDGGDPTAEDGPVDVLEIRGWTSAEARLLRVGSDGDDLTVALPDGGRITVLGGLGDGRDRIEVLRFADDGVELGAAEIAARLLTDLATAGRDLILGTDGDDTLTGGPEADVVDGAGGDDLLIYRRGDGGDRFEDGGGSFGDVARVEGWTEADLLSFRRSPPNGLDLILEFPDGGRLTLAGTLGPDAGGVEVLEFAGGAAWTMAEIRARLIAEAATEGDDRIEGFATDGVLAGGRGADSLYGGAGGDEYVYARGDGADLIRDDGVSGVDRVTVGYASDEVSVRRLYKGADDRVPVFADPGDRLTILDTLDGTGDVGIEEIAFADGVVWGMAEALAALDNAAPVGRDDGIFRAVQGETLVIVAAELLRNDFDPEGAALSVAGVGLATGGTVALTPEGDVAFTAAFDALGEAGFVYTLSDGEGGLSTAEVRLRVRPPASATDDAGFEVEEGGFLVIEAARLLANDTDGDLLEIAEVTDAVNGEVSLSTAGTVTFTPTPGFAGEAGFRYVANTPEGGRAEAAVAITVTPVNDPPTPADDSGFELDQGGTLEIAAAALLANDTDPDGDALTLTAAFSGPDLTVALADGVVTVTPSPLFFGTATFLYEVSDGRGETATAEVTVEAIPVTGAPTAGDDRLETVEDVPLFFSTAELLANDSDPEGDALTVARVFGAVGGSVTLLPSQTVLFEPARDRTETASFLYEIEDGNGGSAVGTVEIGIDPVDDAPFARDENYETPGYEALAGTEDIPLVIDAALLLDNDTDVEGSALSIASVGSAVNGEVAIDGLGRVVFTPAPGFWGEASFRYVAADGDGGVDDARVTLYFAPVSDAPPTAGDDAFTIPEDVTAVIPLAALLANDVDIDFDPLEITAVWAFSGSARAVDLGWDENGDVVVAPKPNFNGRLDLRYTVTDNRNGEDTGAVVITVTPVNDLPVAAPDAATGSLGAPVVLRIADLLANDDDPGDFDEAEDARAQLSFVGAEAPSSGTVWVYGDEFVVFEPGATVSGPASVSYRIADGDGGEAVGVVSAEIAAEAAAVIAGSERRDLLIGSAGAERLEGLGGDDDLYGRQGDDTLEGGAGKDRLDGGEGRDAASYEGSNIGVRADLAARIGRGGQRRGTNTSPSRT